MATVVIFTVAHSLHSVMAVVETRLLVTTLFIPSIIFAVRRVTGVPARDYFKSMWRPFTAAAAMALAIWALNEVLPFKGAPRLLLDVVVGAASYIAAVMLLWDLSGRPRAAEQDILTLAQRAYTKISRSRLLTQAAD